ncbi:MAG TPA: glycosyltransferase [Gemmatimonadales bacterium]|nr:glycosyltransferase [Gemmatimonadales bacterium]
MTNSEYGRIAFFLPSLNGGGAERVILNLAEGITQRGLPVDLVLSAAEGALLDQLPASVRLVDLHARRVLRSLGPLAGYLRKERPRALISSMNYANLVAIWASRLAGGTTPVIATVHTTLSESSRQQQRRIAGQIWPYLLRIFYPWASSVVAVSRGAADDLAQSSGLARDRVEVVYNPVITDATLAAARQAPDHPWFAPGQPPVILGVGRLTRQKDFPTLIKAFAEVRRAHPTRLIIIGEGEDRNQLTALAAELGVSQDVALPGFRNALAYMAGSALFVLSSAWEGLPTVLIEALAAGARVVSTDCPSGPREILQEGRLGELVPVGDVAGLAAAMRRALDTPAKPIPADALTPFTRDAAVDHYLRLIEKG